MPTTVNIHEAKTHLSRLIEPTVKGEEFIIAKAGKPLVRMVAITPANGQRVLGGLAGRCAVPANITAGFTKDIDVMFRGKP